MERIAKYSKLKQRSREMGLFVKDLVKEFPHREDYQKLEANVLTCANYLVFNNYYTIEEIKLTKFFSCKKHMLCPFCAARRAVKLGTKNTERFTQVTEESPELIPAMLTITVKNGEDLKDRFDHLKNSFRKLQKHRRQWISTGRGKSEFCKIEGAAFSYEIAHSNEKGWHPHIHMIVLLNNYIDIKKFSEEWKAITGDSFIVDIRKLKANTNKNTNNAIVDAMQEVFKYAVKFSDLTLERQFEAYETLKGQRLIGSFGLLHGVKIPESLTDDLEIYEELPYIEMHYSFMPSKNAYDLKQTFDRKALVEAVSNEEECTTTSRE